MELREEVTLSKGELLLLSSSFKSKMKMSIKMFILVSFLNIIQFIVHFIQLIAIWILIVSVVEFEWFDWCISVDYVLIDAFVIMMS